MSEERDQRYKKESTLQLEALDDKFTNQDVKILSRIWGGDGYNSQVMLVEAFIDGETRNVALKAYDWDFLSLRLRNDHDDEPIGPDKAKRSARIAFATECKAYTYYLSQLKSDSVRAPKFHGNYKFKASGFTQQTYMKAILLEYIDPKGYETFPDGDYTGGNAKDIYGHMFTALLAIQKLGLTPNDTRLKHFFVPLLSSPDLKGQVIVIDFGNALFRAKYKNGRDSYRVDCESNRVSLYQLFQDCLASESLVHKPTEPSFEEIEPSIETILDPVLLKIMKEVTAAT